MEYSKQTVTAILDLKSNGLSSRDIAKELGISKSGVNNVINRNLKAKGPRVLLFDLETSAALVYCFGRHKQFINQDAVKIEGGKLLVSGYKFLGDEKVTVLYNKQAIKRGEDYELCVKMLQLFSQADVVVAHNAKGFDLKMLETRCLANGLSALPSVKVIDTLELAKRKFRFPSNKLDSLGAYLGLGRKVSHSGIDLWVRVQEGDEKALSEMIEYCEGDVELLEAVFLELQTRGFISLNYGLYYDDDQVRCNSCGSAHVVKTGRKVTTPSGIFNEYRCMQCGSTSRDKENQASKTKRKNLLVNTN